MTNTIEILLDDDRHNSDYTVCYSGQMVTCDSITVENALEHVTYMKTEEEIISMDVGKTNEWNIVLTGNICELQVVSSE